MESVQACLRGTALGSEGRRVRKTHQGGLHSRDGLRHGDRGQVGGLENT